MERPKYHPPPAHLVTAAGIGRTFQNIRLFADMSVVENVMVSFHHSIRSSFWRAMVGSPKHRREENRIRDESMRYLEDLGLGHLAAEKAETLPHGQQRKLEIARALATRPQLLLLDSPRRHEPIGPWNLPGSSGGYATSTG